jgi:hypothetical protein
MQTFVGGLVRYKCKPDELEIIRLPQPAGIIIDIKADEFKNEVLDISVWKLDGSHHLIENVKMGDKAGDCLWLHEVDKPPIVIDKPPFSDL